MAASSAADFTDQPTMLGSHEFYLAAPNPELPKDPHA
jgi:hypothetical protein